MNYSAVFFVFLICCTHPVQDSNGNKNKIPGMVVHRGANRLAPENTIPAILQAIEHGAEYVEVDVRTSKDGVLYDFHDQTVDRS